MDMVIIIINRLALGLQSESSTNFDCITASLSNSMCCPYQKRQHHQTNHPIQAHNTWHLGMDRIINIVLIWIDLAKWPLFKDRERE